MSNNRRINLWQFKKAVGIAIPVIAIGIAFYGLTATSEFLFNRPEFHPTEYLKQASEDIVSRIELQKMTIDSLRHEMEVRSSFRASDSLDSLTDSLSNMLFSKDFRDVVLNRQEAQISLLSYRLSNAEDNLRSTRSLILDDPETAVKIPLIKKDIEIIHRDVERLNQDLYTIRDNEWRLTVFLATISLTLIGTVSALFIALRKIGQPITGKNEQ